MKSLLAWAAAHKALLAAWAYALSLALSGHAAEAAGVVLASLSGGLKPTPTP